jgi:hypothetical protein
MESFNGSNKTYMYPMKLVNSVDPECLMLSSVKIPNSKNMNLETKIRCLFLSKGYRKFPKKEYIRCKLIRGHKRILRDIQLKQDDFDSLLETENSEIRRHFLTILFNSFLENKDFFEKIIPVDAGPVNVMMKKRNVNMENLKRSFNADYCREYLEASETRESYWNYIEYIFSDLECSALVKRFGFRCCTSANHKNNCVAKWVLMKKYCGKLILEDIGIVPFSYPQKYSPQPALHLVDDANGCSYFK